MKQYIYLLTLILLIINFNVIIGYKNNNQIKSNNIFLDDLELLHTNNIDNDLEVIIEDVLNDSMGPISFKNASYGYFTNRKKFIFY